MARPPFMTAPGPEPAEMLRSFRDIRVAAPEFLNQMRNKYGPIVQFPVPKPLTYLVSDPDDVDHVLRSNSKSYGKSTIQYRTLALVTGYGLLAADTQAWRNQRKVVQPAFHHDLVAQVVEHSVAATENSITRIAAKSSDAVDLDHEMMELALNVVGTSLFGADFKASANKLVAATLAGLDVVVSRARTPIFPPKWIPTPLNLRLARANKVLTIAVDKVIDGTIKLPTENSIAGLLVKQLQSGSLSRSQVRDELVTFIVAGHETVASALSWALHLLSNRPDIQQELANEANQIYPGRNPVFNDYQSLRLAQAVFNEAMRLYPPAWIITRTAVDDDVISGIDIKAGSLIVISPWVVHRNESIWPNPDVFEPARFMSNERPASGAYLPFGLGNRMCIGKDFAMFEGVIALSMMMKNFEFLPINIKIVPLPSVTVRPKSGLPLRVKKR